MVHRQNMTVHPMLRAKVGIPADVVLGSPRRNCDGLGICKIERASQITSGSREGACQSCRCKALISIKERQVLFYFIAHSIPGCAIEKYFKSGRFIMEESVTLPVDMAKELELHGTILLKAGNYIPYRIGNHWSLAIDYTEEPVRITDYISAIPSAAGQSIWY